MNITIISVGKIKEKYLVDGINEYKKRLSKYCKFSIIEVPDEKAPDNLSHKEIENVKDKEGDKILVKIPKDSYVIALAIKGHMFDSEELAKKFEDVQTYTASQITFLIGGSHGLSHKVLRHSDFELSFSKMTFPHQLMRLILIEQVYRAFRINNNEPYHK